MANYGGDDNRTKRGKNTITEPRRGLLKATAGLFAGSILAGCGGGAGGDGGQEPTDEGQSGDGEPGQTAGEPGDVVGPIPLLVGELTHYPDVTRDLAEMWRPLGIEFEINTMTWDPFISSVYTQQEFDGVTFSAWSASPDRIDPDYHLSLYTSDSALNIPGFANDEYDELFTNQRSATSFEERNEYITKMQQILYDECPSIFINWPHSVNPVNTRDFDIQPTKFIGTQPTGTMSIIEAEPKGGYDGPLVIGMQQDLSAPNPLSSGSNQIQYVFKQAYDTPLRIGLDGTPQPWALESYEPVESPDTFDLTLRQGMTFHDGEPVTLSDLEFSIRFLQEYSFPKYDPYTSQISNMERQTDQTLRIELETPNAAFPATGLTFINILPEHIWSEVPNQVDQPINWNASVEDLVGSGPLKIVDQSSSEILFERFDDHFAAPGYAEAVMRNIPSVEGVRSQVVQGNVHMTGELPQDLAVRLGENNEHIETVQVESILNIAYSFDMRNPPFDDAALRRALRKATDGQMITQVYNNGYATLGDSTILHPKNRWGRDDLPKVTRDIEAARQILRDAGYTWDDQDRLRLPT